VHCRYDGETCDVLNYPDRNPNNLDGGKMKKKYSLKTNQDVTEVLEYVVNGMVNNEITQGQANPINTAIKQREKLLALRLKYLGMFIDVHKPRVRAGEISEQDIIEKLPKFFKNEE
jgi:hypothetical protein